MMFGWTGRIIDIDLGTKSASSRDLDRDLALRFLGGRGFNSKVLYDRIRPGADPFGPDNVYCIATIRLWGRVRKRGMPTADRMVALDLVDEGERLHSEEPYPVWTGPPVHELNAYRHGGTRV